MQEIEIFSVLLPLATPTTEITPSFSSIPNLCCTATLFLSPSRSLKFSLTSSETKRDLGFKQSLPAVQSVNQLD
ncbi:hypothetical protein L1887_17160 [Cichorium endivia]|nr:hypothetical protein L1887_17160 [Cichorium endivia]